MERLNCNGKPLHSEKGLKRGPARGDRKPPSRYSKTNAPLDDWSRNQLRILARRKYRGHEVIVDAINSVPDQQMSRRTYFNALRGEPISDRTRFYLHQYLESAKHPEPSERTWEEVLIANGMSEEKARVAAAMMQAVAPR